MFRKNKTQQRSPLLFEELEPRVLFSADGLGALAGATDIPGAYPAAHVLVVDTDFEVRSASEANIQDQGSDSPVQQRLELVFVDSNTPDYELLVGDLLGQEDENRRFDIIMLDANRDGIEQITDVLGQYNGVDGIHIVSHGDAGQVQLGNSNVSADNLAGYRSELMLWGAALGNDADILIYGCNLAATDTGQSLVSNLANLTRADVAASEDLTGHSSLGGDWDLEFQAGVIDTDIAFGSNLQQQWGSVLAGSWFDAGTGAPQGSSSNGDDIFVGDGSNDTGIDGSDGDDVLYGGNGDDNLTGGNGDDLILGGDGNDTLDGGDQADILHGGPGDDIITGGNNADTLIGGGGNDTLNGGNHDDLFLFSGAQTGNFYTVDGGGDSDTIDVSAFVSAVDNGSTITVQMGGGDSFTISYTNVEFVVTPGDPGNKAPVADAGADQAVGTGALVTLDASASSDPDPETPTYSWQQISGPWVTLSSSTAEMPTFTAPGSAVVLDFALVASDASISAVDVVKITVGGSNVAPIAVAGGSYVIDEGDSLALDGTGSSDADGTIVEYRWDLNNDLDYTDYTSASATPTLDWATIAAWGLDDGDVGGKDYTIGLQVVDNQGATHAATTTVTINDAAPTLTTTGIGAATPGVAYTLNLAATDPGADTIASWTINWGDGAIDTVAGSPSSITHTYNADGFTYNILASATNEDGTHLQNEFVVASGNNDRVLRYGPDGSFLQAFATSDGSNYPVDTVIGPDGNLYLSGWQSDDVLRYNATTGAFIDIFVAAGTEGLNSAAGLAFGPDGHLYVASRLTSEVLRFDGSSGAFIDAFVTTGSGGLSQPEGLVFSADGDLYVSDYSNSAVYRYDGATGAFGSIFVSSGSGGLDRGEDLTFGPDGHLYVASDFDSSVLRYDGATGAFIDAFVPSSSNGLSSAVGVGFGPDGHLYVSSWGTNEVLRFDGSTGVYIDAFISAGSGGLSRPDYFNFIPQHQVTVASGQTISGTVFEDVDGDGDIVDDGVGSASVTVRLYVDDGSVAGEIDAGDSFVAADTTDGSGNYLFTGLSDDTYWVTVDSATIDPDAGFNGGFSSADVWAEQTYGVAGSVSFAGGYSYAAVAGARYGGMQSETADNAGGLTTAEHVSRVIVAGSDVTNVDSGFSFNVITNTGDDGAPSGRSIQGSLRQFLFNSNAIDNTLHGPNTSQFAVPTSDSNYNGSGNGEFTITPTDALPDIVDSVVLDATTQAGYSTPVIELEGTASGGANGLTISGNDSTIRGLVINRFDIGIEIFGDNARIESNYIGTDVTGQIDRGNTRIGIGVTDASDIIIGGAGAGNVISGNGWSGISIVEAGSTNNRVQGNLIGTNATGNLAMANDGDGISLFDAVDPATVGGPQITTIGGATTDLRNVISGNGGAGIRLGSGSANTVVAGNYIGTDSTGVSNIGNGSASSEGGVYIHLGSTANVIGGTADGAGNLIAFNTGPGVTVDGVTTTGNAILENEIHANSDIGIKHNSGGNQSRQQPVLSIAVTDGVGTVTIIGTYSDASLGADPSVVIDFFSNPGNNQEGKTYLGSDTFSTIVSGDGVINSSISATVGVGEYITATVTDSAGNTSEFSATQATSAPSNNAPTLSGGPYNLGSTDEDTISVGTQVSTILGSLSTSDGDGDILGLAVIAAGGNGGWQYSTDSTDGIDGNWTSFGPVAGNSALLLSNTAWVRYVPDNQNGESVGITFHAWDGSAGSASTTGSPSTYDPAGGGGTTAYSAATAQANLTVTSVNDAPTIAVPPTVFINELHYENVGIDSGEAIELMGPAGTDLTGWSLVLYSSGNGNIVYHTEVLSGTIADQSNGFGTLVFNFPVDGIQNGISDGIALVNPGSQVVQFISYEGVLTAVDGPAAGLTSTDIGVAEDATTSVGDSLQLTGTGSEFAWMSAATNTFGMLNTGQNVFAVDTGVEDTDNVYTHAQLLNLLGASDPDDIDANLTVNISSVVNGSLAMTGGSGGLGTTFTFTPSAEFSGQLSFDYQVLDDDAAVSAVGKGIINIVAANDAPTATNLSTTSGYNEGDASVAITDIVVSDVDVGDTITASLTLANTATGSLSANDGATYTAGTGVWTITDSVANVNTALANLVFTPVGNNAVDTTIGVAIDDGDEDASGPLTGSITLDVIPNNDAPTVALNNAVILIAENTDTTTRIRVADIIITDDGIGSNILSLTGNDAAQFEIEGGLLFVKAGVLLNFEAQNRLDVSVVVNDPAMGSNPDDSAALAISISDVNEAPALSLSGGNVDENTDTAGGYVVGLLSASDPDIGDLAAFSIVGGTDQGKFSISNGNELVLNDGLLDFEDQATYAVTVRVTDAGNLQQSQTLIITVNDLIDQSAPNFFSTVDDTNTVSAPSAGNLTPTFGGDNRFIDQSVNQTLVGPDNTSPVRDTLPGRSVPAETPGEQELLVEELSTVDDYLLGDGRLDSRFIDPALNRLNNTSHADGGQAAKTGSLKQLVRAITNLNPATKLLAEAATSLEDAFDFAALDKYSIFSNGAFNNDLDDFRNEIQAETRRGQTIVGSAVAASTGVSIGYVIWLVRGGVVLSSVLSSLPAWRLIDPLPVLATVLGNPQDEEDDESLASLLEPEDLENKKHGASEA